MKKQTKQKETHKYRELVVARGKVVGDKQNTRRGLKGTNFQL